MCYLSKDVTKKLIWLFWDIQAIFINLLFQQISQKITYYSGCLSDYVRVTNRLKMDFTHWYRTLQLVYRLLFTLNALQKKKKEKNMYFLELISFPLY